MATREILPRAQRQVLMEAWIERNRRAIWTKLLAEENGGSAHVNRAADDRSPSDPTSTISPGPMTADSQPGVSGGDHTQSSASQVLESPLDPEMPSDAVSSQTVGDVNPVSGRHLGMVVTGGEIARTPVQARCLASLPETTVEVPVSTEVSDSRPIASQKSSRRSVRSTTTAKE